MRYHCILTRMDTLKKMEDIKYGQKYWKLCVAGGRNQNWRTGTFVLLVILKSLESCDFVYKIYRLHMCTLNTLDESKT